MTRTIAGLAAAAVLLAGASAALAKAPAHVRTMEDVRRAALEEEADAARRAAEAQRDPNREAIEAYRTKKTKLEDWQRLVEILKDAKTPEIQPYREPAAKALLDRFLQENVDDDPAVRQVRIAIAIELSDLLKADKKDVIGINVASQIFFGWYRPWVVNSGWRAEASTADRARAARKILSLLRKSEKG